MSSIQFRSAAHRAFFLEMMSQCRVKVCYLAFNLWNNYVEERREKSFTPEDLFGCKFAPYFMEGIKVRYPEYCRELSVPKQDYQR